MLRRSKLKVRPAIKRNSGPVKPDATKPIVKPIPTNDLSSVKKVINECISQSSLTPSREVTLNQDSNVVSPVELTSALVEDKKIKKSDEASIQDVSSHTEAVAETTTAKSQPVPQKTRRRKLIACPQTSRKRPKISQGLVDQSPLSTEKSLPASQASTSEVDIIKTTVTTIFTLEERPHTPSAVDSIDVPEPLYSVTVSSEENCDNDDSTCKEYTVLDTVEASPLPVENTMVSIMHVNPQVGQDVQMQMTLIEKPTLQIAYVKKAPEKPKSKTTIQRNTAFEKLKMLKDSQEDKTEWPEIDHNVISMSDLIYLNPPMSVGLTLGMNAAKDKPTEEEVVIPPSPQSTSNTESSQTSNSQEPIDEQTDELSVLPVPQIRIAEDGTVVVDEESLIMDTKKPEDPKKSTVYEFGRETRVNQCSFLRRPHPKPHRWSQIETDQFYRCLCIVGAEFSLMAAMFRKKTAGDLRRKYRREMKVNPKRVDSALMQQHLSEWTDDMFEAKNEANNESTETEKAKAIT